jgi:hypothetical protein
VPFREDREHIACLCAALCKPFTKVYACASSAGESGWSPQDACFAPKGWWNPPAIKEHLLKKDVFPIHGDDARYLAIESNPRTREMYAKFSIPCFWVTAEGTCLTEGTRIVKRLPR